MSDEKKNRTIQEDEIDLVELVKAVWARRKFVAKVTGVFVLIGLVIAFTSPVEYQASCKLLPESQEAQMPNMGGLAGLAGLAGVDLSSMAGGTSGVLTPQLYPEIVNSLPFIMKVLNDTILFERLNTKTTAFHYFNKIASPTPGGYLLKYTVGLPQLIKTFFSDESKNIKNTSDFYRISKKDWNIIENFRKRLNVKINVKTNVITVLVEMPDPYAAAELAKKIELMLTDAVISYKTDKAKANLDFIEASYQDAKIEFENIQFRLADVTDKNKNVSSAIGQIHLKKIEQEYNIAFEVYKGLASQVEQAKIQLKKETPVFTILEPVRVPEDKSKPLKSLILLVSIMLGVFIASSGIIIKSFLKSS